MQQSGHTRAGNHQVVPRGVAWCGVANKSLAPLRLEYRVGARFQTERETARYLTRTVAMKNSQDCHLGLSLRTVTKSDVLESMLQWASLRNLVLLVMFIGWTTNR